MYQKKNLMDPKNINHLLLNPNQIKNSFIFVVKYIVKASIDFI